MTDCVVINLKLRHPRPVYVFEYLSQETMPTAILLLPLMYKNISLFCVNVSKCTHHVQRMFSWKRVHVTIFTAILSLSLIQEDQYLGSQVSLTKEFALSTCSFPGCLSTNTVLGG